MTSSGEINSGSSWILLKQRPCSHADVLVMKKKKTSHAKGFVSEDIIFQFSVRQELLYKVYQDITAL